MIKRKKGKKHRHTHTHKPKHTSNKMNGLIETVFGKLIWDDFISMDFQPYGISFDSFPNHSFAAIEIQIESINFSFHILK